MTENDENENIITSLSDGKNFRRKVYYNDNKKPILVCFHGKASRMGDAIVDILNFMKSKKGQIFYEEILKIRTPTRRLFSKSLNETFNHELIKGVYIEKEKEKYKSANTNYIIELYLAILEQFGCKEELKILFADEKNPNNVDIKCLESIIWTEPYALYDSEYDNSVLHTSYELSNKLPKAGSNIIIIIHKDGDIIDASLKDDHPQKREIRFSKDVKKNHGITLDSLNKGKKFEAMFGCLYPNIGNHLVILDIQEKIIGSKKVTESVPKKMTESEKVTIPIIETEIEDKLEKIKKDSKDRAEKISIEEYVKMFHERLRQGLYMYNETDIEFFFSSILSGQWNDLRGVNGIGKDFLLILFGTLSTEDFNEQVLVIPASVGLEIDDSRILGYHHALTDKFYYSRYTAHISKANKNPNKLYIIIITEANIVNIDKSFVPISVAIDSANTKITIPRYQKEDDTSIEDDPEITNNILIFITTNDIIRRPELSLKDIDRMNIMNLIHPVLRKTEDRKKLINKDGTNNYNPIIGPDHLFVELCRRHILTSRPRITNVRDLYWIDDEYRKFEDDYQDDLVNEINKLNHILKNGHLRNAQMALRFEDDALKFLYAAIEKLKIDPKLAKDQLMLQRFIPRIEDVTEQYIDTIVEIRKELIGYLSEDAESIKEIDEIIWKKDPHFDPNKK